MRRIVIGTTLLLLGLVGACSSPAAPPTGDTAPVSSGPSPTPSTSTTPRSKAQDAADAKRSLVTADDLGKPWVQPKSVNRVGKANQICPGKVSALNKIPFTADVSTDLTEGKGTGKNIISYRVQTLSDPDVSAVLTAIEADNRACARYKDAIGFAVVRTAEGPTTVPGGDYLAGWAERVYYIKPHKLAYARHYLVAHQGRVVSTASYAFLATAEDPKAKDFAATSRLLEAQLTKTAEVFD